MNREEFLQRAKAVHDSQFGERHCDPKYIMSCSKMPSIILAFGGEQQVTYEISDPKAAIAPFTPELVPVVTLRDVVLQCEADSRRWFPKVYALSELEALAHHALAACGEAGELANEIKKVWRGDRTLEEAREKIVLEAMDTFIYLMNVFAMMGIEDVYAVYNHKRAINAARFERPQS